MNHKGIELDETGEVYEFVRNDTSGLTFEVLNSYLNYVAAGALEQHTSTQLLEMSKLDWDL